MIHNVKDLLVDINGMLFPAVNIQVDTLAPGYGKSFALYFEVMFENGFNLTVYQEDVKEETLCENPHEHFIVEVEHRDDGYIEVIHAYHARSERRLAEILNDEKYLSDIRDEYAAEEILTFAEEFEVPSLRT